MRVPIESFRPLFEKFDSLNLITLITVLETHPYRVINKAFHNKKGICPMRYGGFGTSITQKTYDYHPLSVDFMRWFDSGPMSLVSKKRKLRILLLDIWKKRLKAADQQQSQCMQVKTTAPVAIPKRRAPLVKHAY